MPSSIGLVDQNNVVRPRFPVIGALPSSSHLPFIAAENRRPIWPHTMERSYRFISDLDLVVVMRPVMRSAVWSSPGHNPDIMNSIGLLISPLSQLRKTSQVQCVPSAAKALTFPDRERAVNCFLLSFESLWSLMRGDSKNCIERYIPL